MANRLVKPWTRVGVLENFCLKASLKLCAGSVDMIRTLFRTDASCTARLEGSRTQSGRRCKLRRDSSNKEKQRGSVTVSKGPVRLGASGYGSA